MWVGTQAEAVYSQDLYPLDQFLSSQNSIYHWSYVGAVLNWGLEKIGLKSPSSVGDRGIVSGQFVVVRNVEVRFESPLLSFSCLPNRQQGHGQRYHARIIYAQ